MIRMICGNCLRLFDAQLHGHRSTCPHCGGPLRSH
jgi:rRNA maturation endonuclease Nob1